VQDCRFRVSTPYHIKELFWSVQGEGANAGTPSIFVRFSGCNQWTGREADRSRGLAECARWCDTDFLAGERLSHQRLVARIAAWQSQAQLVVFTGGEPALQLTSELLADVESMGLRSAIETNGTVQLPHGRLWITVSPKGGKHPLVVTSGDELKVVFPQHEVHPAALENLDFKHFFLQPLDNRMEHARACIEYMREHPRWRLSLQTHKFLGMP
jgi:7-carboxy-7-deazaguanine synthase (Cx14CxxC type)